MGKEKFSIQELLVDAIQNADMGGLEDAVLVFSRRGDDKGTLINYLLGCTMKYEHNKKGKKKVLSVESYPDSTGRYPKIGHKVTAETLYPAKYTVQSQADRSISYVDFPGFEGNRGISTSALELIATQVAIKTIKSVRTVVFVVSWNEFKDPKLLGLKESLKNLSAIFKNLRDRLKSITLVISHLPKDGSVKKKDVLETLRKLHAAYHSEQAKTNTVAEDDVNLMGFLEFFIGKKNKAAENIILFDPLVDDTRNKMISNINKNVAFLSEEINFVGGESVEQEFLAYIDETVRAGNTVFEKLLTLPEYKQTLEKAGSRIAQDLTKNYTDVKENLKSLDKELIMYTGFFETNRVFYHALIKLNTIMNFKSDLYSQFCENFIKVLKMRNEENWNWEQNWEQTRINHPFFGHRKPAVRLIGSPGKSTIVSKMLNLKYRIENTSADRQGGVEKCVKMGDGMNSQTLFSQDIEAERDFCVVFEEDNKKENYVDCATIASHVVSEPKPLLLMYGRASVESRLMIEQANNQLGVLSSDCKQDTYYQNDSDNGCFFDAGDWDNVIHQHPETGGPVFTYRAYKDGREVGSASFSMHPLLCRSEDGERHNIIASTGIFSDLKVEARSLESVCAALPPTMFDKVVTSAIQGGKHGAVRGVANVIGYTLQARNVSAETAYYIQQAVCYGGYFLLRFNEYMAQVEEPDFRNTLDATLGATVDTGTVFITNVVADQFRRVANRLGEYAQESGWTNTGKVLRFLGDMGRYSFYAYDISQRGELEAGASVVTAGVAQSVVEGLGKAVVKRFLK